MFMNMQSKAVAMLFAVGLVAGCSTTGDMEEGDAWGNGIPMDEQAGSSVFADGYDGGISTQAMTEEERRRLEAQAAETGEAALRRITVFYFDFDASEIKREAQDALIAHAAFLRANPNRRVRLEGHTDERGTKEYNMALGERRANAVQRFLVVNGAARNQIEVVSYGEEKPAAMGQGEAAWAQNRRVELMYR